MVPGVRAALAATLRSRRAIDRGAGPSLLTRPRIAAGRHGRARHGTVPGGHLPSGARTSHRGCATDRVDDRPRPRQLAARRHDIDAATAMPRRQPCSASQPEHTRVMAAR